jgi:hypothetical protein
LQSIAIDGRACSGKAATDVWRRMARRVARRGCPRPAPEEPSVIVSHHSARAAQRPASIRADPGTRNAPRATFAIPTHSRCTCLSTMLEVHTPVMQRPFAFPHINGSPSFLATYHLSDVGSLSRRVTSKPVSVRLQNGIRFFRHPTPAPPWAGFAACCPRRERYGNALNLPEHSHTPFL